MVHGAFQGLTQTTGPVGAVPGAADHVGVGAEVDKQNLAAPVPDGTDQLDGVVLNIGGADNVGIADTGVGAAAAVLHAVTADEGHIFHLSVGVAKGGGRQILHCEVCDVTQPFFQPIHILRLNDPSGLLGGGRTLMGMGTVFGVLILISLIIYCFRFIGDLQNLGKKKTEEVVVEAKVPEVVEEVPLTEDLELVAVITAAIAASEGTSTDSFVVRSIHRR